MKHFWRALLLLAPVLIVLGYVFHRETLPVIEALADGGVCVFYRLTGLYCPGCGSTRAVMALLHGRFLLSFHENPMPLTCLVLALLGYIELWALTFGKKLRLLPRKWQLWAALVGLYLVWAVVRNFVPALMPLT